MRFQDKWIKETEYATFCANNHLIWLICRAFYQLRHLYRSHNFFSYIPQVPPRHKIHSAHARFTNTVRMKAFANKSKCIQSFWDTRTHWFSRHHHKTSHYLISCEHIASFFSPHFIWLVPTRKSGDY